MPAPRVKFVLMATAINRRRLRCCFWIFLVIVCIAVDLSSAQPVPQKSGLDLAAIDRERILKAANTALDLEPPTIAKYHAKLSEGGPNDFYSNADYFWPDPTKPDGLPYINRDGKSNPGNF